MRLLIPSLLAVVITTTSAFSQSLTTTYAGGNSGSTAWTNQFNITVLNPAGVWITAFDVNCENSRSGPVGSHFTLDIWKTKTGGTYVGNQTNAAAWTRASKGSGISRPQGLPTPVDVTDFFLPKGQHGLALEYNGTAMAYTNGTGPNQKYANADIQLDLGSSTTGLFLAPVYNPRVWNGTVHYFAGKATCRLYGESCKGSAGLATMLPAKGNLPRFGSPFKLDLTNLPNTPGPIPVLFGRSSQSWGGLPLPFDLTPLGATGCNILCSGLHNFIGVSLGSTGFLNLAIPNDPILLRARFILQAIVTDSTANNLGITLTNAVECYVGN